MSKPIHPDAPLVSKAIRSVDRSIREKRIPEYFWSSGSCCLAGCYRRYEAGSEIGWSDDMSRLSTMAFNIHVGLKPNASEESRNKILNKGLGGVSHDFLKIPWNDWNSIKENLCKFYNLADEEVLA